MSQQAPGKDQITLKILYEVLPTNEQERDPFAMKEVMTMVVTELKNDGYTITPVETGTRSGFIQEITPYVEATVQYAITHKDDIVSTFKTVVVPILSHIAEIRKQRQEKSAAREVSVLGGISFEVKREADGWSIKGESKDLVGTEQLDTIVDKLLERLEPLPQPPVPRVIEEKTPQTIVKISEEVPPRPQRRRR